MKKMLVLILLIGLAATADAAIVQFKVNGSMDGAGNDTIVNASSAIIYVNSDTDNWPYAWFLAIPTGTEDEGYGEDIIVLPAAGGGASAGPWIDQVAEIIVLAYPPNQILAGDHFETTLFRTGSAVQIDLLDDGWNVIDSVTLVPEPATILLLGLGGLMLRRRRAE